MKASKVLTVLAGAAILASCSEEFDFMKIENPTPKGTVFRAYTDNGEDTRTQLSENDSKTVYWSPQEFITVFDGEQENFKFVSTNTEPSASAGFTLEDSTTPISEPDPGDYFYALYPYDADATLEEGIIHTSYPSSFEYSRYGSFQDNMNLAVAKSANYSLSFKNLQGWIRLGFTGDATITKIVFKGNNGEKLAGKVAIDPTNLTFSVEDDGSSDQMVFTGSFTSSGSDKETGCYYYIPVLSLTFEKGFTFIFYKDDGTTYTYTLNSSVSFNRGQRRRLWVDFAALNKQYTYTRVVTPTGASAPTFNDGDEYIVAYPAEDGSYKVFDPNILLGHIEQFSWSGISLKSFLQTPDFRYGTVGTKLFNNDYITVAGNDEFITVDPGIGITVTSKSLVLENETASFPKSKEKTQGLKMSINSISTYQWDTNANKCTLKGNLDPDDTYIMVDQMLSRHGQYYDGGTNWNLLMLLGGGSLKNLVSGQYNGDYSITAGYVSSEYNGTHYEGFAFKDKLLYKPSIGLQKIYIYRRTPANE